MKLKIKLADLLYDNNKGPSYNLIPLNIGYVASYAKELFGDKLEIDLYRNPNKLIDDINECQPSIVGFSQYIWNDDLTRNFAEWIKTTFDNVIIITGGPMIGSDETSIEKYLKLNPLIDFCVPVYGEYGFSEFLSRYIDTNGDLDLMKATPIAGVSFRKGDDYVHSLVDQLILAKKQTERTGRKRSEVDLDDIPSPYLNGMFDGLLSDGYSPMIQGMRGCPYKCSFCFASKLNIAKFSDKRVMSEISYIYEKTKSPAFAITDDNFGLYRRDLDIAKKIRNIYDTRGYPDKLLLYYSKKPTNNVMEISKLMGGLAPHFVSYQTRNEDTLKVIDRYNILDDNSKKVNQICRDNGVDVASEMIFGLPNETKESFIAGVEDLYNLDTDIIAIYHCKFFNGVDIASDESRSTYRIKTMHRYYEGNFQAFDTKTKFGQIIACETDEVPVSSSSYDIRDYFEIRMLGFWIELFFAKKMYYEVLKHLESYNIRPFSLIRKLINYEGMPGRLRELFADIDSKYRSELFESHEDLKRDYEKKISNNERYFKSIKINLYFGYLLLFTDLKKELDRHIYDAAMSIAGDNLSGDEYETFVAPLRELVFDFHSARIVNIEKIKDLMKDSDTVSLDSFVADVGNHGLESSQRYMVEGTESSQLDKDNNNVDVDQIIDKYTYSHTFNYDFISWEKDGFKNKLSDYNGSKSRYSFCPKNIMQYVTFCRMVDDDLKPFQWHNYIYPGNVKQKIIQNDLS
jgi:radical SAM superfamily enzyme YgiQ (UPF0313 family)